jgi:hypothetical protein
MDATPFEAAFAIGNDWFSLKPNNLRFPAIFGTLFSNLVIATIILPYIGHFAT